MKKKSFRSGFAAVVGKPNVGKSTLMNKLLGEKVVIVSPKPQTTRRRALGVKTTAEYQLVFVDTPGLALPRHLLGERMVEHSKEALTDCDVCLFVVDVTCREPEEEDRWAHRLLMKSLSHRTPSPSVYLVANKVDEVKDKRKMLPVIERYSALGSFAEVFPVSALAGDNLPELESAIVRALPEGPAYFPEEAESDQDENFRIAEIIREKVLLSVHQEVPHGAAVFVDEIRPGRTGKSLYVRATIFVQRESHRGIVVGKNGQMLKKIGTRAREEISKLRGQPVYLDLWIKVKKDWQEREEFLHLFGYS